MARIAICCLMAVALAPAEALAGMPTISLTDVARMRLQSISFFLVGFLLSAWVIQLLWNYLRRDFTMLPRLSYPKALGVTSIWGLLFVLVLTMISGARELMTPGAWERNGSTYKLAKAESRPTADGPLLSTRVGKLQSLWLALVDYAGKNDGKFPNERSLLGATDDIWEVPDVSKLKYYYVGGSTKAASSVPVAFEPEIFGSVRLVLFSNGDIKPLTHEQLVLALPKEER